MYSEFLGLVQLHFRVAVLPTKGESAAVPTVNGKPLFAPSRRATVAVGSVLLLFAGLIAATAGIVSVGLVVRSSSR